MNANAKLNMMITVEKQLLTEYTEKDEQDKEYTEILHLIQKYIDTHCNHKYVNDSIDIDYGEKSKLISYCEYCYRNKQ